MALQSLTRCTLRNAPIGFHGLQTFSLPDLSTITVRWSLPSASFKHLGRVVAVEITGGPTINFVPGRKDSKISPKEGRLPDAKKGLIVQGNLLMAIDFVSRHNDLFIDIAILSTAFVFVSIYSKSFLKSK